MKQAAKKKEKEKEEFSWNKKKPDPKDFMFSNLKNQELLYKQIDAMVEAGNRPKSDLYDQLATVKNRQPQTPVENLRD